MAGVTRDANALHRALDTNGDPVEVSLSRETAELVSRWLDACAGGQEILVTRGKAEVTPTEAAALLGMSRPRVRKLMDQGRLDFRKVGSHHRIPVASVRVFVDAERSRRREALTSLSDLQNEFGLDE